MLKWLVLIHSTFSIIFCADFNVAIDRENNFYVADSMSNSIRRIGDGGGTISRSGDHYVDLPFELDNSRVNNFVGPFYVDPPFHPDNIQDSHEILSHQQTIADLTKDLTRNPKRPGSGFTSQELGVAITLTQTTKNNQNQQAYLAAIQEIFSPARARALLNSMVHDISEEENKTDAVNMLNEMQQKLKASDVLLIRYKNAQPIVNQAINNIVKQRYNYSDENQRTIAHETALIDVTFNKLPEDTDYQHTISIAITFLQIFHPDKIETWAETFLDVSENESKSLAERVTLAMHNICDGALNSLPTTTSATLILHPSVNAERGTTSFASFGSPYFQNSHLPPIWSPPLDLD